MLFLCEQALDLYCNYCHNAKYANISDYLHIYRVHNNSVSVKYNETQKKVAKLTIENFLKSEGLFLSKREFEIHCSLYLSSEDNHVFLKNDINNWYQKIMSFANQTNEYSKDRIKKLSHLLMTKVRNEK